jgi:hypothetical protein
MFVVLERAAKKFDDDLGIGGLDQHFRFLSVGQFKPVTMHPS